jgi:hypothetical protein
LQQIKQPSQKNKDNNNSSKTSSKKRKIDDDDEDDNEDIRAIVHPDSQSSNKNYSNPLPYLSKFTSKQNDPLASMDYTVNERDIDNVKRSHIKSLHKVNEILPEVRENSHQRMTDTDNKNIVHLLRSHYPSVYNTLLLQHNSNKSLILDEAKVNKHSIMSSYHHKHNNSDVNNENDDELEDSDDDSDSSVHLEIDEHDLQIKLDELDKQELAYLRAENKRNMKSDKKDEVIAKKINKRYNTHKIEITTRSNSKKNNTPPPPQGNNNKNSPKENDKSNKSNKKPRRK